MWISRTLCVGFLILLSLLLLSADPWAILGFARRSHPVSVPDRGVHFAMFAALTLLVHVSRWTSRRTLLLGVLAVYAVATELLQALVPPRTVDPIDALENLLGIAAGTLIFWLAQRCLFKPRARDVGERGAACGEP